MAVEYILKLELDKVRPFARQSEVISFCLCCLFFVFLPLHERATGRDTSSLQIGLFVFIKECAFGAKFNWNWSTSFDLISHC